MRKAALTLLLVVLVILPIRFARSTPVKIQVTPLVDKMTVNDSQVCFSALDLGLLMTDAIARKTPIPLVLEHSSGPHGGAAAGWLYGCAMETNGIWCKVSWTTFGRDVACTGAWRFISPNMKIAKDSEGVIHPVGFVEVSLTNSPAIDGMASVPVPGCPIPFFSTIFTSHSEVAALR